MPRYKLEGEMLWMAGLCQPIRGIFARLHAGLPPEEEDLRNTLCLRQLYCVEWQ